MLHTEHDQSVIGRHRVLTDYHVYSHRLTLYKNSYIYFCLSNCQYEPLFVIAYNPISGNYSPINYFEFLSFLYRCLQEWAKC